MKLPIMNLMAELILSMPVHSTQLCVQLDEPIIAQGFIVPLFTDGVSILLEEFIGEKLGNDEIVVGLLRVCWLFVHIK